MTTTLDTPHVGTGAGRFTDDEIRVDGNIKTSGQARYTADFSMPGMLWADFVSSTVAHAKIVSIDTEEARAMPGVHAVLTGNDILERYGERYFGRRLCDWPVLSYDRVRFIGEYVVAVAADTPQIAAAAVASIVVEYEELPGLFDTEEALQPDALILHEHPEKYPFMFPKRPTHRHKNIQGYGVTEIGDVEAGLAASDRVFEHVFTTPRYHGGYIEPRATLIWIDDAALVHIISTNKSPFSLREQFSVTTGLPKEQFVVHPSYIGGDFGAKGLSVEEFPVYFLAAATGRPVKFVRNYLDDIRSTNVRHASKIRVKTGVMNDGKIVALYLDALFDGGAYAAGKVIPTILPGPDTKFPYAIPHQRLERTTVYTNSVPGGFVRAPGDVQAVFAAESALDLVARDLGIEPLEFRMLNCAREGDLDIEGHTYLAARGAEVLEVIKRESDYGTPVPANSGRGRGVGFSVRHIGGGKTSVTLLLSASGNVEVHTGTTEQGMGILTLLNRTVARDLGLDLGRVRVGRGGTDVVPFDPGVGASRTTHIVGGAALDATRQLRADLEAIACEIAGLPPGAMELRGSQFAASDGSVHIAWDAAAAALVAARGGETLSYTGTFDGDPHHGEPQYNNFNGYVVDVTVDRETGAYTINDVVFCVDAGTIINPVAHRGQIDGGFMMGLGHAMTEELIVDEGRIANLTFADYKLPCQMDMPPFHVHILESDRGPGPFGARAVGEVNTSAFGPALANAVHAAVGVRITQLPVTAERIYEALHAATA
jgi:CO/xanthine dehydrogenase Mo-binding subunit